MFDLKLPDHEIIVWIKNNDFGKKLEKEILPITKGLEIYDDIKTEDRRVYHWIVPSWLETLVFGGKLKEFIGNPNLIFLKLKANDDPNIEDVTLKDNREMRNHDKT
jgi:predicted transglutaminase-like protease